MSEPQESFIFSSPAGLELVRDILKSYLSYDPHIYQLEGVCRSLDGQDLLAILPTGSGKTGLFYMYMLVLIHLGNNTNPIHSALSNLHKNPVMVIIYPTNGLEEEQEAVFIKLGLRALAINSRTLEEAYRKGENLWEKAREGVSMLLLSPEQLISKGFESLLQCNAFWSRIRALGVDEIHLLDSWGQKFRNAFLQIGYVRARLPPRLTIISTTATLLAGGQTLEVRKFLHINPDCYVLHRSNVRHDLRIIFRTLQAGIGGWTFRDLLWVLKCRRKTIVFCPSILLGFHLMVYLWYETPLEERGVRVRLYNALNFHSHNVETQTLIQGDPCCQVVISTDILMVGINYPNIEDVILLGEPKDTNEYLQKIGRAGRDPQLVRQPRGIVYLTKKATEKAKAVLAQDLRNSKPGKLGKGIEMSIDFATMILAACKIREQNTLYGNPMEDDGNTCATNLNCGLCSGCNPEFIDEMPTTPLLSPHNPVATPTIAKVKSLTKVERAFGEQELKSFRWTIFHLSDTEDNLNVLLSPTDYLPDPTIKLLLDKFNTLKDFNDLGSLPSLKPLTFLTPFHGHLWRFLVDLKPQMDEVKKAKALVDKVATALKLKTRKAKEAEIAAAEAGDLLNKTVPSTSRVDDHPARATTPPAGVSSMTQNLLTPSNSPKKLRLSSKRKATPQINSRPTKKSRAPAASTSTPNPLYSPKKLRPRLSEKRKEPSTVEDRIESEQPAKRPRPKPRPRVKPTVDGNGDKRPVNNPFPWSNENDPC